MLSFAGLINTNNFSNKIIFECLENYVSFLIRSVCVAIIDGNGTWDPCQYGQHTSFALHVCFEESVTFADYLSFSQTVKNCLDYYFTVTCHCESF